MNKIVYPFIVVLLLLVSFSCADDKEEIFTNQIGSKKEIIGNMKVSTFKLPLKLLIIERLLDVKHKLISLTDNKEYEFGGRIKEVNPDGIVCELHIPKEEQIPDGDYALSFYGVDNSFIAPTQFTLTFEDEMVSTVLQQSVDYSFLSGEGTEASPYLVDDLEILSFLLNFDSNHARGLYFKQTQDISKVPDQGDGLQGRGFVAHNFAGNYDGGGFEIANLYHRGTGNAAKDSNIGLFAELLNGASVSNLKLNNVQIIGGVDSVGVIAAKSSGTVKLSNIEVSGSLRGANYVGGLIGYASGKALIEDITLNIAIEGTGDCIGGLIGKGGTEENKTASAETLVTTITKVRNTPSFSIEGKRDIGGLIGNINGSFTIKDVKLKYVVEREDSDITILKATERYLGGIIGRANLISDNSISDSDIQLPISGEHHVGGFIGSLINIDDDNIAGLELVNNRVLQSRITSTGSSVGGFIGRWDELRVNALKKLRMEASVTGVDNVGGFMGYALLRNWHNNKADDIVICPIDAITATENNAGGLFGYIRGRGMYVTEEHASIDISPGTIFTLDKMMKVNGRKNVGGFAGYSIQCNYSSNVSFEVDNKQTIINFTGTSSFSGAINNAAPYNTTCENAGGLFGFLRDATVTGVMTDGAVSGGTYVGGIAGGDCFEVSFVNCARKGEAVNAKGDYAGGICAYVNAPNIKPHSRNLVNFSQVNGADMVGGVFGKWRATSEPVTDLINVGTVSGTGTVGGVIGKVNTSDTGYYSDDFTVVTRSVNFGDVSGSYRGGEEMFGLGGVIGTAYNVVKITECANHGVITAKENSTYNGVGGVVGVLGGTDEDDNHTLLHSCCNTATVQTFGRDDSPRYVMGGVLGRLFKAHNRDARYANMHNCYNKGAVKGNLDRDTGGILGAVEDNTYVHECINIGKVEHGNGGVGTHPNNHLYYSIKYIYILKDTGKDWSAYTFTDSKKKDSGTFDNFSFGTYWQIDFNDKNDGFPYLTSCYYQFAQKPVLE